MKENTQEWIHPRLNFVRATSKYQIKNKVAGSTGLCRWSGWWFIGAGLFFFTCHELLSRSDLVWLDLTRPGQRQRVVFLELIGGQQKKFEKESIITSQLYPLPPNHFPSSGDPGQRHAINSPSKGVFSESRERSLGSL